jgi:hypothetical protein
MASRAPKHKIKVPTFVQYLRAIGAAALLLGASGVMFTSPTLFWWAASFLYVGFGLLIIDIWCEPNFSRLTRYASLLIVAGLALAFTRGIVFYPNPLEITVTSYEGKYKNGELIYGIEWEEGMSDLRIDIYNSTDRNYDNLDLKIIMKDGLLIRDQKQFTNIPGVSLLPVAHELHIRHTDLNGGLIDENNVSHIPHDGLRVLCDKLPKKTAIGLILAVSDLNPIIKNSFTPHDGVYILPYDFPPPYAVWVHAKINSVRLSGEYSVLNRPFQIETSYPVSRQ